MPPCPPAMRCGEKNTFEYSIIYWNWSIERNSIYPFYYLLGYTPLIHAQFPPGTGTHHRKNKNKKTKIYWRIDVHLTADVNHATSRHSRVRCSNYECIKLWPQTAKASFGIGDRRAIIDKYNTYDNNWSRRDGGGGGGDLYSPKL